MAARRRGLRLSQRAAAERAGITQTHLSKIERGALDPRLSTVLEVARAATSELVLVPAELLPAVRAILEHASNADERLLFSAEPD
ncbi:MAG TPA: helix-turn-helix domain-containing protein [Candidatus Elarobacter sp.]